MLSWSILPILQAYLASGFWSIRDKLKQAIKDNLLFQLMYLSAGVIILIITISKGWSLFIVKDMIIALSHGYTLVLALWIMCHGLITLPKRLYRNSKLKEKLNHYYLKVGSYYDKKQEYNEKLEEIIKQVQNLKNYKGEYEEWVNHLLNAIKIINIGSEYNINGNNGLSPPNMNEIDKNYLSKLTRDLKSIGYKYISSHSEYEILIEEVAILHYLSSLESSLTNNNSSIKLTKNQILYHKHIKPMINLIGCIICSILSIIILWSELTHSTKISLIPILTHPFSKSPTSGTSLSILITYIFLIYMSLTTQLTTTRIQIFNIYSLSSNGNSNPSNLCWYEMYGVRMIIPICFNYLTISSRISNISNDHESGFEKIVGDSVNLTALGKDWNDWVPRAIVIIPLLIWSIKSWLNKNGKKNSTNDGESSSGVMKWLRSYEEEFDESNVTHGIGRGDEEELIDSNQDDIEEGKGIIERELILREHRKTRQLQNQSSSQSQPSSITAINNNKNLNDGDISISISNLNCITIGLIIDLFNFKFKQFLINNENLIPFGLNRYINEIEIRNDNDHDEYGRLGTSIDINNERI